jgi:tetrapyrrole methylase family protein/MazG family protein
MPLLIVPLAPDEIGQLTLDEWDALARCEHVSFERPDHPLRARLAQHGVPVDHVRDEPDPSRDGHALVADPSSPGILDLVREGATVALPAPAPDALTAAHGASVVRRAAYSVGGLAAIMARLRSEDGCPWDRQQTPRSLEVHLLEEAHEVVDAIEGGDAVELCDELGDLLLQVVFHAQLACEDAAFDLADIADGIVAKLLRRHPHVFEDVSVSDAYEVVHNWEAIKSREKRRSDPFADIPRSLPALLRAYKTQKRAAAHGFEPREDDVRRRLAEILGGGDEVIGDALFWVVALARAQGVDPETALLRATKSFAEGLAAG